MKEPDWSTLEKSIRGTIVARSTPGYEAVRRSMSWNARKPERFPDAIVHASCEADVRAAVEFAGQHGLKVAVRGGGHSWCGSSIRDGGLLLDLSALREIRVDAPERRAYVQPGATGRELQEALAGHGLAFPVPHCPTVPLSGFLLAGGFGWNSGGWGPACASVVGIDLVDARGEAVYADADNNADLFWAARGAGAGFFAVVTGYHILLHALPHTILTSTLVFPMEALTAVATWLADLVGRLPSAVELSGMVPASAARSEPGAPEVLVVSGTAFADSEDDARSWLRPLEDGTALGAIASDFCRATPFHVLYDDFGAVFPPEHRYVAEVLSSDAPPQRFLPLLRDAMRGAPSPRSASFFVLLAPNAGGAPDLPDMAFSLLASTFVALYGIWDDPAQDHLHDRWLRTSCALFEPVTTGHYIGETDLGASFDRAARSYAPARWQQLQQLKQRHDPRDVFFSYPTPPPSAGALDPISAGAHTRSTIALRETGNVTVGGAGIGRTATLPPGPRSPAIWQLYRWVRGCPAYLETCRRDHGDPFTLRWPTMGPVVFVGRPEGVRAVYAAATDVLSTGPAYDYFRPVLGRHSLLVLDGARHRRERRLMTPAFHGQRMVGWAARIEAAVRDSTAHWSVGQTVAVRPTMAVASLQIILDAVFGDGLVNRANAVTTVTDYTRRITGPLFFVPLLQRDLGPVGPGRGFQRTKRATEDFLGAQIRKRRQDGTAGRSDVLSSLIDARDEDGLGLSDSEVLDELRTVIAAGHETGATALAWALHWVQSHAAVERRLREELACFTGEPAELAQLPYLAAVCDETLRICPPTPHASRMVEKPLAICGYDIPAGTRIAVCAYLTHRDREVFPDPERFDPDRFLNRQFGRHEFHPFGGGSRRCIGAAFAVFQMRIALATLLRWWRFAPVDARVGAHRHNVTLAPAGGRPLHIIKRLDGR